MKKSMRGLSAGLFAVVFMTGIQAGAELLVRDEFNSAVPGIFTNGIYTSGLDLGDPGNSNCYGGTIVGFDSSTAWTDSSYIEAYAGVMRVKSTQYSLTSSGRAITISMAGRTEAYGKVAMRQNLAAASLSTGYMYVGFSHNAILGSLGGAMVGYKWDNENSYWDLTLRYNVGGSTLMTATIIENVGTTTQDIYWKMNSAADTIDVWVDNDDAGTTPDLTVTDWDGGSVEEIAYVSAGGFETGLSYTNFVYVYDIQLGDAAEDIGMIPAPLPAGLLVREEFNSAVPGVPSSGIYTSGGDLGDAGNANTAGGTIVGFDNTTSWTDSSYIEAYASLMRIKATQYSWTYSGRVITNSMVGKTEAYGKVVMRQKLAAASATSGGLYVGFGSSDSLGSLGGAAVGYMWDAANSKWDLALRYRNSEGVVMAVVAENATNVTQDIYWSMDADTDTIKVWVDENNLSAMPNLTVTDWNGTVEEITHLTVGEFETGLSTVDFVYVYDIRLGETPESIGMEIPPATATAEILSIEPFSDTIMKLVVSADHPALCYPKSAAALTMNTTWGGIAHSANGVDGFITTNLDYSTASGIDFAIYIEAGQDKNFIKIGAE